MYNPAERILMIVGMQLAMLIKGEPSAKLFDDDEKFI